MQLKVHGTILSPWVRRLLAFIEEKGQSYEVVNVVPLGDPDPDFLKISPLGKVPVLEFNGRFLPDSLAACALLEAEIPEPSLFPKGGWDQGWMLWLCDYLSTAFFSKVEAPLFIQNFVNPNFRQTDPDPEVVAQARAHMPAMFDYLEGQLKNGQAYLQGDHISLADLTAGSIFVNLRHAGESVDANAWPNLADYVERLHARASFQTLLEVEKQAIGGISPMFAR